MHHVTHKAIWPSSITWRCLVCAGSQWGNKCTCGVTCLALPNSHHSSQLCFPSPCYHICAYSFPTRHQNENMINNLFLFMPSIESNTIEVNSICKSVEILKPTLQGQLLHLDSLQTRVGLYILIM